MKKIIVWFVVIVLVGLGIYYLMPKNSPKQTNKVQDSVEKLDPMKSQIPAQLTEEQKAELSAGSKDHSPTTLTYHITGGSFYFTPNEITAKAGDKIKIVFTNVLGLHNLIIDDLKVSTKTIKQGETDTIEFEAEKKGTYEFYCGVGNGFHRMMGQIGVLLVK